MVFITLGVMTIAAYHFHQRPLAISSTRFNNASTHSPLGWISLKRDLTEVLSLSGFNVTTRMLVISTRLNVESLPV